MQNKMRVFLLALAVSALTFAATTASRDFWHELQIGNDRFVTGHLEYTGLNEARHSLKEHGQYPPITILSCADSRVPPELIFRQSLGDLFVVRVAGNVTDLFPLTTIEYAVGKHWTKMIVVMGHEDCGAVKDARAAQNPPPGSLFRRIKDNVQGAPDLTAAIKLNARKSAKYLTDNSRAIHDAVCQERLEIVPAYYDFDNGRVVKLDPLPGQPSYPCR